ncbi:MAG: HAMP domain-containing histidine kinase [Oscillospiraceae bacterium]|nr:HAMP domain-containing histidine kinase [Oscillospiraceae bacterium]
MERLKRFLLSRTGAQRWPLARRWTLTAFLPSALAVALAAALATVYVLLIPAYRPGLSLIFIWAVAVAAVLALWLLGRRFLRTVTEPVAALTGQAERIRAGALGARSEKVRDDELGELSDSINAMSAALEQGEALQSQFISSVSHELRTPLTAITGWTEAMAFDPQIQGESRRGLEIISREAQRLTKMVGELLEFTRIQDGRFNLNLDLVDLLAEVEDVLFTYSSLLRQEGVSICYSCDETDIPPIQADPERIKQVLLNLLDNAVKHGKGGAVDVSVHLEGEEVVVRVRDHGPGIPEVELPHVKERFYKGSSRERGSGIGLAVCDEIVSRHGGKLLIENHSEGGVLATVRLPVKP